MLATALSLIQVAFGSYDSAVQGVLAKAIKDKAIVGAGVAVVRNGRVVLAKGYGLADRERAVRATEKTRFEIGSITKQFAATLLMQLVEERKVDLDAPISKYVAKLPTAWSKVKVRHVLSHTAGLPNYTEVVPMVKMITTPGDDRQAIDAVASKPLQFEPGSSYSYSNTNYIVVGMIIASVEHRSFEASLRARVLIPLGMNDTFLLETGRKSPLAAVGYSVLGRSTRVGSGWPGAAGAIISTAADMGKWLAALGSPKLLPKARWDQMWTKTTLSKGGLSAYGFGFVIDEIGGAKVIEHAGGINGFNSEMMVLPTKGVSVVVLANIDGTGARRVALDVAKAVEPTFQPDPVVVPDANPKRTAHDKQALIDLLNGTLDPNKLGEDLKKLMAGQKTDMAALNAQFGALKAFEFAGEKAANGIVARRYIATYEQAKIQYVVSIDAKGIIVGLGLRPM